MLRLWCGSIMAAPAPAMRGPAARRRCRTRSVALRITGSLDRCADIGRCLSAARAAYAPALGCSTPPDRQRRIYREFLVPGEGIEPPTNGLQNRYLILTVPNLP